MLSDSQTHKLPDSSHIYTRFAGTGVAYILMGTEGLVMRKYPIRIVIRTPKARLNTDMEAVRWKCLAHRLAVLWDTEYYV